MLKGSKGGFTNATDVADYLVKKGLPFREAHAVVGRMVFYSIEHDKALDDLYKWMNSKNFRHYRG